MPPARSPGPPSVCLLPPPQQSTQPSPPGRGHLHRLLASHPRAVPSSVLLLPFASFRDFDSLSKDNVFENNRLVSPQLGGSPRGLVWGVGGGQGSCRAGAVARGSFLDSSLRSCPALGPWLLLSPAPCSGLTHLFPEHQASPFSGSLCGARADLCPGSPIPLREAEPQLRGAH